MSHPSKGNSTKVESLFEALFVCLKRFKWIMRTSGRLKKIINEKVGNGKKWQGKAGNDGKRVKKGREKWEKAGNGQERQGKAGKGGKRVENEG